MSNVNAITEDDIEPGSVLIAVVSILTGIATLLVNYFIPSAQNNLTANYVYPGFLGLTVLAVTVLLIVGIKFRFIFGKVVHVAPLLIAGFGFLLVYDVVSSKLGILPRPFYPSPDKVVTSVVGDWKMLLKSLVYSLRLLFTGYAIGSVLGFASGIAMGWNKRVNYWLTPVVRIIGPIPATAWIPIAMTVFPTSFAASVFLIVLGVWFPVTVMTSSGIANVPNAYFEVAKTLGAGRNYLIFKVAVPSAAPMIFIGLFSGLGIAFVTLVIAEMLGVKAGIGWYINWTQGWGEYGKVWGALLVLALVFSGLISLLFKIKDRVLVWQKGLIKW
jgi:NitT/TauT family transport system permease protein